MRVLWVGFVVMTAWAVVACSPEPEGPAEPGEDTGQEVGCQEPTSILLEDGAWSGFERCADGAVNRVEDVPIAQPVRDGGRCQGDESEPQCTDDAGCGSGEACMTVGQLGEGPTSCACVSYCTSDAECEEGYACVPPGVLDSEEWSEPLARCVPAACRTGDDCASGECGTWAYGAGACGTERGLACRDRLADGCRTNEDCPGPGQPSPDGAMCTARDRGEWLEGFACEGREYCDAR